MKNHYTGSVPSGKSHYVSYREAFVVWAIPANKNLARFLFGRPASVWELSRLWAPDGHDENLLTQAISRATKILTMMEDPDAVVSYADPNVGHSGGVYRAASWLYHGRTVETRAYLSPTGAVLARRAFHSGSIGLRKAEIELLGYSEMRREGKHRYVRPLKRWARKAMRAEWRACQDEMRELEKGAEG
jgi:hypothetical protein